MSANIVICPLCNDLAPVIDMTPAPRFAWCEACRALHRPMPPAEGTPAKKPRVKKSKPHKPKES